MFGIAQGRGEDLSQSVLKGAVGLDAPAHVVHPIFGNALDTLLPGSQKGQRPSGVTQFGSAMASGPFHNGYG